MIWHMAPSPQSISYQWKETIMIIWLVDHSQRNSDIDMIVSVVLV